MLCAVDANTIIYALNRHSPWHSACAGLLERGEKGKVTLHGSELLLTELTAYPQLNNQTAAMLLEDVLSLPITIHAVNREILVEAGRLRREYRIKLADAIHVASALSVKADYFVSNDQPLMKKNISHIAWHNVENLSDINMNLSV